MSTLAERIAAKKAAAAQDDAIAAGDAIIAAEKEVAPIAPKPFTFAEKLALKRGDKTEPAQAVGPLGAGEPAEVIVSKPLTFAEKLAAKKNLIATVSDAPSVKKEQEAFQIDPERIPEDPEEAQAFVDIVTRIHALEDLMDIDLERAMGEFKAAVKKNPAASELILDTEIGKTVTALRRMRHLAVTAATKEKKEKTKTKPKAISVNLTPEELAQAWDEL